MSDTIELATIYNGSKGAVPIATMNGKHAATAAAKLRRTEPERIAEIEALEAHAVAMAIEHAKPDDAAPAPIGDNGGPPLEEPKPLAAWDAIKIDFDDLLTEAGNWADGVEITNQDQADSVGRLRGMLQQAISAADDARVAEKKPLDEQIAEIQDRYNAYIAPLKNKVPGKASKAVAALGNLLTAWLNKLDAEKRVREQEAAAAAAKAAAEALAAREEAKQSSDLTVMDRAEDLLADAETMLRQAKGVAREKVQAGGGDGLRAQALRTSYVAEPTGAKGAWNAALVHYMGKRPEAIKSLLQELASADARDPGQRAQGIPGFTIKEIKHV